MFYYFKPESVFLNPRLSFSKKVCDSSLNKQILKGLNLKQLYILGHRDYKSARIIKYRFIY